MQHTIGHYPFGLDGRCDVGEEVKRDKYRLVSSNAPPHMVVFWVYADGATLICERSVHEGSGLVEQCREQMRDVVTALNSHADFVELAQRVLILESDCECDPDADYGCLRCLAKSALAKAGEA